MLKSPLLLKIQENFVLTSNPLDGILSIVTCCLSDHLRVSIQLWPSKKFFEYGVHINRLRSAVVNYNRILVGFFLPQNLIAVLSLPVYNALFRNIGKTVIWNNLEAKNAKKKEHMSRANQWWPPTNLQYMLEWINKQVLYNYLIPHYGYNY